MPCIHLSSKKNPSMFPTPDSSLYSSRRDIVLVMRAQTTTEQLNQKKNPDTTDGNIPGVTKEKKKKNQYSAPRSYMSAKQTKTIFKKQS